MKKKYSLDYTIERDVERLAAVKDILDSLPEDPTHSELEQMASYILYGKDENGKNASQRGETTTTDRRHKSFKVMEDKNLSLNALMDEPLQHQTDFKPANERYIYVKKQTEIRRPKYDKKTGELVDIGDADVPGLPELWERIDYLEKVQAANEGKIPFDPSYTILKNDYQLYQLRHMIIDLRLHQYYLKDLAKPALHFVAVTPPKRQFVNWDSDAAYWISLEEWERRVSTSLIKISKNLKDYTTRRNPITKETEVKWYVRHHNFDWENPAHVKELIDHYSALKMELNDEVDTWGRTLIWDLERYVDMCNFSPLREYILLRRVDHASLVEITKELEEKFGVKYVETRVCNIIAQEIPNQIATAAKKHRLIVETPQSEKKQCYRCKRWLPRTTLFFGINNGRKDHWASNCKECERKRRISKGIGSEIDGRRKEAKMYEVQAGKTNS